MPRVIDWIFDGYEQRHIAVSDLHVEPCFTDGSRMDQVVVQDGNVRVGDRYDGRHLVDGRRIRS